MGQLLVKISRQSNSLVVLQLALVPDLGFITSVIRELVKSNFYQCMSPRFYFSSLLFSSLFFFSLSLALASVVDVLSVDEGFKEEILCPACVEHSSLLPERIGTITVGDKVCFNP